MSCDPADVGGAPIDIIILHIKDPLGGVHRVGQIAAGGMDNTLGLAGRAGGIEDEQRVLGIHRLWCALAGDVGSRNLIVPPRVTARLHWHLVASPLDHNAAFHRWTSGQRGVSVWFQGNSLAGAQHCVRGNQHLGLTVLNPALQGYGRETCKNYRMNGTNAGTGEQGNRQFRDHRQINGNPVAFLHALLLQDVGKAADFGVQHLVGIDLNIVLRLALPNNRGFVAAAVGQVAVKAVGGDVQLAALKPLDFRLVEIAVHHLVPLLVPGDELLGPLGPEAFRVVHRAFVDRLVLLKGFNVGSFASCGRRGE